MRRLAPVAIIGLFTLAMLYTLYFARALFLPLFLAILLSFVFRPIVRKLHHLGVPRGVSAGAILVLLLASLAGAGVLLSKPAGDWIERAPDVVRTVERKLWPVRRVVQQAQEAGEDLLRAAQPRRPAVREVILSEPSFIQRALGFTGITLLQILLTIFLMFYLLVEGGASLSRGAGQLMSKAATQTFSQALETIETKIGRYLGTVVLINLGVALVTTIALYFLDMPNPLLWGAVAGALGLMPYLGPVITMGLFGIVGMASFDSLLPALAPMLAYMAINYIEGEFITPMILGRTLSLPPIAVFLSIMIWTWLWGAVGALLAVPILVALTVVLNVVLLARKPQTASSDAGKS